MIGMADLNVGRDGDVIVTLGLGSCVGITLYDPITHIGGMAHIMLPTCPNNIPVTNRAKFADLAIGDLLLKVLKMGASRPKLQAKLAGGAHMFSKVMGNDILKVGERNAATSKEVLQNLRIPVIFEDTGGTHGRTIELNTANGQLTIKTIGKGVRVV
jgi:chemotaxis protein CheD